MDYFLPPADYYDFDKSAISAEVVYVEKHREHPDPPKEFRWPPPRTAVYVAEGGATTGGAADVVRSTARFATGGATAGGAALLDVQGGYRPVIQP